MKCTCGNELLDGSKFCNQCGKAIGLLCSNCGVNLPVNSKFCNICGTSLENSYEYFDKDTGQKFMSEISPEVINNCADEIEPGFDFETWVTSNEKFDRNTRLFLIAAKDKVVWIGDKAVKIGKFLWSIVLRFQNTFKGVISAAVIGILFAQIPLLGFILGPLVFAVLGTAWGLKGLAQDAVQSLSPETRDHIESTMKATLNKVSTSLTNKIALAVNNV